MMKRALFDITLFLTILFAPWWLALLIAIYGVFYFTFYYEVLVFGVLYDVLYGTMDSGIFGFGITGFLVSFVLFIFINRLKRELR